MSYILEFKGEDREELVGLAHEAAESLIKASDAMCAFKEALERANEKNMQERGHYRDSMGRYRSRYRNGMNGDMERMDGRYGY